MARNKDSDSKEKRQGESGGQIGPGGGNIITRPFILIGQIIYLFFDVATLMLRMLFYTLVYDTPHGKTEVLLDTATRED